MSGAQMLVYIVDNKDWCPDVREVRFVRGEAADRAAIEAAITVGRSEAANWRFGGGTSGSGGIIAILPDGEWLSQDSPDYDSTQEFCALMVDEIFTQDGWAALVEEVGAEVVGLLVQAGVEPPTRTTDLGQGD